MGRVAVMELLATYPALNDRGIDASRIWPNFAMDAEPRTDGIWLILRWGPAPARWSGPGGKRSLNVWAYQAKQRGTDYTEIDLTLGDVISALITAVHYEGTDGSVLSCADFNGLSQDLVDEGYDAIARNAEFTVLCR